MSEVKHPKPGAFCWDERATRDAGKTLEFYTSLFGWTVDEWGMGEGGLYRVLKKGDFGAGGLFEMKGPEFENVPPHWMAYIEVENVDATVDKAVELGGNTILQPTDIPDIGRFAVVQDPQGAVISLMTSIEMASEKPEKPAFGAVCWHELATTDAKAASDFYMGMIGWSKLIEKFGDADYTLFMLDKTPVAGMMQMTEEWQGAPPHWMTVFSVESCDESADNATRLGARVIVPPTDIPGTGRFANLMDPEGAVFSIIQLNKM